MTDFAERVAAVVRCIPIGSVASYGSVAARLGQPRAARQVGRALHALPEESGVPWWRVVDARGRVAIRADPQAARLQRALLEAEGIDFGADGRIDMDRFGQE